MTEIVDPILTLARETVERWQADGYTLLQDVIADALRRVQQETRRALLDEAEREPGAASTCRQCGGQQAQHCDFDEPGLDHTASCPKYHHEFKPSGAASGSVGADLKDEVLLKAIKLLEALSEPCTEVGGEDHSWRLCRRCMAIRQFDFAPDVTRILIDRVLKGLREAPSPPPVSPGHDWMDKDDPRMARWPSLREHMTYRLCFRCGVVERRDGQNKPCPGVMPRIALREDTRPMWHQMADVNTDDPLEARLREMVHRVEREGGASELMTAVVTAIGEARDTLKRRRLWEQSASPSSGVSRELWREYVEHKYNCPQSGNLTLREGPCTCGLAALLTVPEASK